jgi:nicotinamide mononucleotide adenylyltransferase
MDYTKPTAQMLGRWQPFHDGHIALFKEILKKTGQVQIMVRTMPTSENNPFEFNEIKKRIEEKLKKYKDKFEVIKVANITNICYGRDVGYKIEEIVLSKEIQEISATKIRQDEFSKK